MKNKPDEIGYIYFVRKNKVKKSKASILKHNYFRLKFYTSKIEENHMQFNIGNIDKIVFRNCNFDKNLNLKLKNDKTKVLFENCNMKNIDASTGKIYIVDSTVENVTLNHSHNVTLKGNNTCHNLDIVAHDVKLSGELDSVYLDITASRILLHDFDATSNYSYKFNGNELTIRNSYIDNAGISTKVKDLLIDNSSLKAIDSFNFRYQTFNTHNSSFSAMRFKFLDKIMNNKHRVTVTSSEINSERSQARYYLLLSLRKLRDQVNALNRDDINKETEKLIKDYQPAIMEAERKALESQKAMFGLKNELRAKQYQKEKKLSARTVEKVMNTQ